MVLWTVYQKTSSTEFDRSLPPENLMEKYSIMLRKKPSKQTRSSTNDVLAENEYFLTNHTGAYDWYTNYQDYGLSYEEPLDLSRTELSCNDAYNFTLSNKRYTNLNYISGGEENCTNHKESNSLSTSTEEIYGEESCDNIVDNYINFTEGDAKPSTCVWIPTRVARKRSSEAIVEKSSFNADSANVKPQTLSGLGLATFQNNLEGNDTTNYESFGFTDEASGGFLNDLQNYEESEDPSSVNWLGQFFKTKLCPYFIQGCCLDGKACRFAHEEREIRRLPDLRRTKLCSSYIRKEICKNENCAYAHQPHELRTSSADFFKVSLCNFYKKGKCWNGANCRFAHGVSELRTHSTAKRDFFTEGTGKLNCQNSSHTSDLPNFAKIFTEISSLPPQYNDLGVGERSCSYPSKRDVLKNNPVERNGKDRLSSAPIMAPSKYTGHQVEGQNCLTAGNLRNLRDLRLYEGNRKQPVEVSKTNSQRFNATESGRCFGNTVPQLGSILTEDASNFGRYWSIVDLLSQMLKTEDSSVAKNKKCTPQQSDQLLRLIQDQQDKDAKQIGGPEKSYCAKSKEFCLQVGRTESSSTTACSSCAVSPRAYDTL